MLVFKSVNLFLHTTLDVAHLSIYLKIYLFARQSKREKEKEKCVPTGGSLPMAALSQIWTRREAGASSWCPRCSVRSQCVPGSQWCIRGALGWKRASWDLR